MKTINVNSGPSEFEKWQSKPTLNVENPTRGALTEASRVQDFLPVQLKKK